jgi:hypothetical protein
VLRAARDRVKFQESIDRLENWSREWQLLFNVFKCKIMHGGRQNAGHSYKMGGRELEVTKFEKDVGVMVEDTLKPSMQCAAAAAKATGFWASCVGRCSGGTRSPSPSCTCRM